MVVTHAGSTSPSGTLPAPWACASFATAADLVPRLRLRSANKNGFSPATANEWANFGQGAPETGPIPGGSERPGIIDINALGAEEVLEYAPTTGTKQLRTAVADLYNHQYRQGKQSQYTANNVCIVPGGRAGLTRVASVIGSVFVSYQVPECKHPCKPRHW